MELHIVVFSPPSYYLTIFVTSQHHGFNAGHGQQATGLLLLLASNSVLFHIYTFLKCFVHLAILKVPLQNLSLH